LPPLRGLAVRVRFADRLATAGTARPATAARRPAAHLFYLHAQPPLLNLIVGVMLKVFGAHAPLR